MSKKGQVTIFVIIGMIIVVGGLAIYMLIGSPTSSTLEVDENPRSFIQNCVEDDFWELIDNVSLNGGSRSPEFYHPYYGNNVEFLCYTDEFYKSCSPRQLFLRSHIEEELLLGIDDKVESCLDNLESSLREKGYVVSSERNSRAVTIIPERMTLKTNYSISLKKEEGKTFDIDEIVFSSNIYTLISIAKQLVYWERIGSEMDTMLFMQANYPVTVHKYRDSDDVKVYILKDEITSEKFQFAIRSMAYPGGGA
ncbi:MAG: hypothetical protein PF542_01375 [Nanoarchaeota archaeon]|jgi:hypothetical protein|nr:hypothetical protein [Nanoarchaeota archaeon]